MWNVQRKTHASTTNVSILALHLPLAEQMVYVVFLIIKNNARVHPVLAVTHTFLAPESVSSVKRMTNAVSVTYAKPRSAESLVVAIMNALMMKNASREDAAVNIKFLLLKVFLS